MSDETVKEVEEILGESANTHWGKRIIEAAERGRFTFEDEMDADDWELCACGKLTNPILVDQKYFPIDTTLSFLGVSFSLAVDGVGGDVIEAARCLVAIEKRANELTGAE